MGSQSKDASKNKSPDERLNKPLVGKAVNALLKYHEKQTKETDKEQLFGTDALIYVQFNLEVPPVKHNPKPLRLVIPHEIYKVTDESEGDNLEEPEVCLIVKDDAKPWLQEMITKFPEYMGHIKKVLTLSSLRAKHNEYKQRRELLKKYSVFMADMRILPMLHKALGKRFWDAGKQPIPIRLTRKEGLPKMIRMALRSTYLTLNTGLCITAKGGYTGMPPEKLVENCLAVAEAAAEKIPRGWANIRSIGIKTHESTMLPIYNKTPAELEEIAKLAGLPPVYVDDEEEEEPSDDDDSGDDKAEKEQKALEAKKKRGLEATKSPLLKALKKQKKLDQDESSEKETHAKETKGKKDKSATSKEEKRLSTESLQGKRVRNKEDASVETPPEKKKRSEEGSKKKKSKKQSEDGESKKERQSLSKTGAEEDSSKSETGAKKEFMASKKFAGSKKGYVFKKGAKGLGYYVDNKPIVDPAKVGALLRSLKSHGKEKRGSGKTSKGKRRGGRW